MPIMFRINGQAVSSDAPPQTPLLWIIREQIKLMGTIVAISGIELLKVFVNIKAHEQSEIYLRIGLHLTFVVSGVLFAVMDRISGGHEQIPGDVSAAHERHRSDVVVAQPKPAE